MKKYKDFLPGDEVKTHKDNWRSISANVPYIVLSCYTPILEDNPVVRVIDIMTDKGFINRYATDKFVKTDRQIRDDKLKDILT